jgi:uncharacterized membrane protein YfcA
MTLMHALTLLGTASVAGALNSVAGGGSFLTFPALLFVGVPPVVANATSTVGLWPASVSSGLAYRREFRAIRSSGLLWLAGTSFVGGLLGAILLLRTSDSTFVRLVPYLLLAATVLFTVGPRFSAWIKSSRKQNAPIPIGIVLTLELVIAIYGGYFGGGVSILLLAALSLFGMTEIHEMNAAKVMLGAVINGISVVAFVIAGAVDWTAAVTMALGAIGGGYFGAAFARKIAPPHVRKFVLMVAWAMTAIFFVKSFYRVG